MLKMIVYHYVLGINYIHSRKKKTHGSEIRYDTASDFIHKLFTPIEQNIICCLCTELLQQTNSTGGIWPTEQQAACWFRLNVLLRHFSHCTVTFPALLKHDSISEKGKAKTGR